MRMPVVQKVSRVMTLLRLQAHVAAGSTCM
jgi:hypothetical protein